MIIFNFAEKIPAILFSQLMKIYKTLNILTL